MHAFLLAVFWASAVISQELPEYFPRCDRNDPELSNCLMRAMVTVLPNLLKGVPEIGLPPLDPAPLRDFELESLDGVTLKLNNGALSGMKTAKFSEFRTTLDEHMYMRGTADNLTIHADYEMEGTFLEKSVNGKGRARISFVGISGEASVPGTIVNRDGKHYREIQYFMATIPHLDKLELYFEELEGGEEINDLMNDNWQEVWLGLERDLQIAIQLLWKRYYDQVFTQIPLENILLNF